MRALILLWLFVGCTSVKLFDKEQRVWIIRSGPTTDADLYRCADMSSGNEAPRPLCVRAFYDDKWQPGAALSCDTERRVVDERKRALLERRDQAAENNLAAAERALAECLRR